jgi:hypothetical protein
MNAALMLYVLNFETAIQSTVQPSVIAQIRLQRRLDVGKPLEKAVVHLAEELVLLLKQGRELVHVGVRGLALEPGLGVGADDVLDAAAVEAHEDKVLEFGVHRDRLVLLGRAAHIDTVLRLAVGDDAYTAGRYP